MRCTRVFAAFGLVSTLVLPASSLGQQPEPFTPLFNGRNLDGWDTADVQSGQVQVEHSVLRLRGYSGWLLTASAAYQYRDYRLRFDARFRKGETRGGVLFHALAGPSAKHAAYELRLADFDGHACTLWLDRGGGSVPFTHPGPTLKLSSGWRTYELEVKGRIVRLTVDGRQLFHVAGLVHNTGRVGLFVYNGEIEFRKIRMQMIALESVRTAPPALGTTGSGLSPLMVLRQVKPQYTEEARNIGAQGEVRLECVVLPDGTVGEARVVRPLYPGLDENAVTAAKQWRFAPVTRNEGPVHVLVTLSMSFRLNHDAVGASVIAVQEVGVQTRDDEDLSARCAAALAVVARAENIEGKVRGNAVVFPSVQVRLQAQLDAVNQKDDYWFVGLKVTASCSNAVGSSLSAGIVSVGRTRADTLDAATKNWAMFTGAAVVGGCVLKERSLDRYQAGDFDIYPGFLAIHGQPIQFGKDDHARLLDHLLPVLQNLASDRLHSVDVLIARNADGSITGEARLDGSLSNTLFEAAKTFAWPTADASYLFKQYYVLERTR